MKSCYSIFSDAQWEVIAPVMPDSTGTAGGPFKELVDHRGHHLPLPGRDPLAGDRRDLPEHFGSWKTAWKRHRRYGNDATWDTDLGALLSRADTRGLISWEVSMDSTVNRAHQHGTNLLRDSGGTCLMTRIFSLSRLTMPSASPAAG